MCVKIQAKKASESEAAAKQTLAAMMNEAEKKDGIILELRAKAEQKSQVSKDHDSLTADLQKVSSTFMLMLRKNLSS